MPGAPGQVVNTPDKAHDTPDTSEQVMILVEGKLEKPDRQALIDRLNEIREEACREGVPSPVTGEALQPEEYVPLQWSEELYEIAVLRAAESTILQDHLRPDGSECFSAAPEGVAFTTETLAWGFGSAAVAVEGWYSEKTAYVEETGMPAGHYMALINPENRFVGIADLRPEWQRDACAGAFASHSLSGLSQGEEEASHGEQEAAYGPDAPSQEAEEAARDEEDIIVEWYIPLRREYLPAVIERAVAVTAARICQAAQLRTDHAPPVN